MIHPQEDSSPPSQGQEEPIVESVVRIHYENDLDDDSSSPEEERPLIAQPQSLPGLTARSNLRSTGRMQERSDHSLHTLQGPDRRGVGGVAGVAGGITGRERGGATKPKVNQWSEWCRDNGLHPSTWTGQTYIKAALLATLLTLVILAFTVLRVQDHIKDILQYVCMYSLGPMEWIIGTIR